MIRKMLATSMAKIRGCIASKHSRQAIWDLLYDKLFCQYVGRKRKENTYYLCYVKYQGKGFENPIIKFLVTEIL